MTQQTIFRSWKATGKSYTPIVNKLLQDPYICCGTKGMLCKLLSKPKNANITKTHIVGLGPDGRIRVERYMAEAIEHGYLKKKQKKGRGVYLIVSDDPHYLSKCVDTYSEQSVFRQTDHKDVPFTIINNILLRNTELPFDTIGMICSLLSRPIDWRITARGIMSFSQSGKDKIYRQLKEALLSGYMARQAIRDEGRFAGETYLITDDPEYLCEVLQNDPRELNFGSPKLISEKAEHGDVEIPNMEEVSVDKQNTQKPSSENSPLINKDNNKIKNKQTLSQTEVCDGRRSRNNYSDGFEQFWRDYASHCKNLGRPTGTKLEAYEEWQQLEPEENEQAKQALELYVKDCEQADQKLKHCCSYLRHKAWEAYEQGWQTGEQPFWRHPKIHSLPAEFFALKLQKYPPNGTWPNELGPPPGHPETAFREEIAKQLKLEAYQIGGIGSKLHIH